MLTIDKVLYNKKALLNKYFNNNIRVTICDRVLPAQ